MIIGQTIQGAGTYYSPWFPRQGDSAVFGYECFSASTNSAGTIFVQTKMKSDIDPVFNAGTLGFGTLVSASVGTINIGSGMKELVRFQYILAGSNWAHFRVTPPAWRLNGAQ